MLDYERLARIIKCRTRCSTNEAWDGLSCAFLSLDKSRTESEQAYYLLKYGACAVYCSLRYKYNTDGTQRFTPLSDTLPASNDRGYDFLDQFPSGLTREFAQRLADGESSFTSGSASHWLRQSKGINTRTSVRKLLDDTREAALRLLLERT